MKYKVTITQTSTAIIDSEEWDQEDIDVLEEICTGTGGGDIWSNDRLFEYVTDLPKADVDVQRILP